MPRRSSPSGKERSAGARAAEGETTALPQLSLRRCRSHGSFPLSQLPIVFFRGVEGGRERSRCLRGHWRWTACCPRCGLARLRPAESHERRALTVGVIVRPRLPLMRIAPEVSFSLSSSFILFLRGSAVGDSEKPVSVGFRTYCAHWNRDVCPLCLRLVLVNLFKLHLILRL